METGPSFLTANGDSSEEDEGVLVIDEEGNQQAQVAGESSVEDKSLPEGNVKNERMPRDSNDPYDTLRKLKLVFEEKFAELNLSHVTEEQSSIRKLKKDDSDDEYEHLTPGDKALPVDKPKIMDRPFEEEITRLLKAFERMVPTREKVAKEPEMPSELFDVEDSPLSKLPDILFQFDEAQLEMFKEVMGVDLDKFLERIRNIDNAEMEMVEDDADKIRITIPTPPMDDFEPQPGPSTRTDHVVRISVEVPEVSVRKPKLVLNLDGTVLDLSDSEDVDVIDEAEFTQSAVEVDDCVEGAAALPLCTATLSKASEMRLPTFYDCTLLPEETGFASSSGMELNREVVRATYSPNSVQNESLSVASNDVMHKFYSSSVSVPFPSLRDTEIPTMDEIFPPEGDSDDDEPGSSVVQSSVVDWNYPSLLSVASGVKRKHAELSLDNPDRNTEELLRNLGAVPKAGVVSQPGERRYDSESVMTAEEDQLREFKGHRNVSGEEVPPWCLVEPRTRSPISRNICGFLNTGMGGSIYVGILNNGLIRGESMTHYQQDHFLLSLRDTLERFRPPVPLHLVKTSIVPVLHPWDRFPAEDSKSTLQYDEETRCRPHRLRTYVSCWCDLEAAARLKQGIITRKYVLEIHILPVDPNDPLLTHMRPNSAVRTRPTFQADDAQIYFRKHASTIKFSMRDIEERAKDEVLLHKMPQLMTAWSEYLTYKKLVEVVQEALVQQGDGNHELLEKIRLLEREADQSTYRLVQERHPLYRY